MRAPMVPITPGRMPAARAMASSSQVVVVLPLVPVTPSTASFVEGWPQAAAATGPIAARTEATRASATGSPSSRRSSRPRRARFPSTSQAGYWLCGR